MSAPAAGTERDRKAEHIELALQSRMQLGAGAFDEYAFGHEALPEIDLDAVDTSITFLGKRLSAPILISCMTGGTELANRINLNLATGAELRGVAVGVGSQRRAIEDPAQATSFRVRQAAPSVPLLANLGAVQLNYGFGVDECRLAVEMIDADALVLHLNPLQEALQPEGQTNFSDLLPRISAVIESLAVPVIAKEVGSGLSELTARRLAAVGINVFDVAGVGGTSWARIEADRSDRRALGEIFAGWGLTTPESIQEVRRVRNVTVIGSGGVRSGLDIAKAIALGADLAGLAYPFLEAATESPEQVAAVVDDLVTQLRISMFCLGARTIADLSRVPIERRGRR